MYSAELGYIPLRADVVKDVLKALEQISRPELIKLESHRYHYAQR